jgi:uncharacterized protein
VRIDAHTHIGQGPGESSAEDLLAMLERYGIDRAVTFPGPSGLSGSPRQIAAANEYVAAVSKANPGRIVGFGTVNPWHEQEAWTELERLTSLGLRGVKLHPPLQGFVVGHRALMDPILERAAHHNLPVVIHAGLRVGGLPHVAVDLGDIRTLALSHPAARLVVAHSGWGGRDARGVDALARDCANVWFDTSGINIPSQIQQVAQSGGADRIVYGSDFPFLHPKVELLRVELAELSAEVEAGVRGGNAMRLLGD